MDGKPHGLGVKTWPDGRKYDGTWDMGKPTGKGKKIYPDGRAKEGYWDNGNFIEGGNYQRYHFYSESFLIRRRKNA